MCEYKNCKMCPRECGIDRTKRAGVCGATDKIKIAIKKYILMGKIKIVIFLLKILNRMTKEGIIK